MGRKVLLSVLGISEYKPTNYTFNSCNSYQTNYVQVAITKELIDDNGNIQVIVFTTKQSKENNWIQRVYYETNANNCPVKKFDDRGLKFHLENNIKLNNNMEFGFEQYDIKDGNDEDEIWSNFEIFYGSLKEGDEIFLDITHSMRSIPIILLAVLQLAKCTKNIQIKDIYYGTFFSGDKKNEKIIPIGTAETIISWSSFIDVFLKTGYYKLPDDILTSAPSQIKEIDQLLNTFSINLLLVRGTEVVENAVQIQNKLNEYLIDPSTFKPEFKPFSILIDKIKKNFKEFKEINSAADDFITIVENFNLIVKMCLDFNLEQQAITFLSENMKLFILKKYQATQGDFRTWTYEQSQNALAEWKRKMVKSQNEIAMQELYNRVFGIRNRMNHANFFIKSTSEDKDSNNTEEKTSIKDLLIKFQDIMSVPDDNVNPVNRKLIWQDLRKIIREDNKQFDDIKIISDLVLEFIEKVREYSELNSDQVTELLKRLFHIQDTCKLKGIKSIKKSFSNNENEVDLCNPWNLKRDDFSYVQINGLIEVLIKLELLVEAKILLEKNISYYYKMNIKYFGKSDEFTKTTINKDIWQQIESDITFTSENLKNLFVNINSMQLKLQYTEENIKGNSIDIYSYTKNLTDYLSNFQKIRKTQHIAHKQKLKNAICDKSFLNYDR